MASKSDVQKQLDKLSKENKKLHSQNDKLSSKLKSQNKLKRRAFLTGLLITASVLLIFLGNIFYWSTSTIANQKKFAAATGPIIQNEEVQSSVALYATNQIFNNIDVAGYTKQALPEKAAFLANPITNQIKSFVNIAIKRTLADKRVQKYWNDVVFSQHKAVFNFIKNYQGEGKISLSDAYNYLGQSFVDTPLSFLGSHKLPKKVGSITITNSKWLPAAHRSLKSVRLIDWTLIILIAAFISIAFWISRNRSRLLIVFGSLTSLFMVITLAARNVGIQYAASSVDAQYSSGVSAALRIFTEGFRSQTIWILSIALIATLVGIVLKLLNGRKFDKNSIKLIVANLKKQELFNKTIDDYSQSIVKNRKSLFLVFVALFVVILLFTHLSILNLVLLLAVALIISFLVYRK